jgi:hypothetical protein
MITAILSSNSMFKFVGENYTFNANVDEDFNNELASFIRSFRNLKK